MGSVSAMIDVLNHEELPLWLVWVNMTLEGLLLSRRGLRVGDFTDKRIELEPVGKPVIGRYLSLFRLL